jgi:hypothetical protein
MNRRLVKKKRPAKSSHKAGRSSTVRKASSRVAASRKTASRQAAKKPTSARAANQAAKASAVTKKSAPTRISSAAKPASTARTAAMAPVASALVKLPFEDKIVSAEVTAISVAEVTALSPPVRAHKFRVGQTVSYTSSPISRPGASGSYQVVRLLPSDGDDYQYRIKNPGEAFERVAKESQLELDH